ncbi:hypothetical protein Tco_0940815 [Tanacetum coccineum]|uniref:Uncharacterized protein n=1 Tax=Tanacetum coccineum TaxID=301880 RepID=A0ABQ5DP23_9ASTR
MVEVWKANSILDRLVCGINQRCGKDKRKEIKKSALDFGSYSRYGCQDKKGMEKQHGVNIIAMKVQIECLRMWLGKGRGSGKSRDGNECVQRDAMLHVTDVVEK